MDWKALLICCESRCSTAGPVLELARLVATWDVVPQERSVQGAATLSFIARGIGTGFLDHEALRIDRENALRTLNDILVDDHHVRVMAAVAERVSEKFATSWTPHAFSTVPLPPSEAHTPRTEACQSVGNGYEQLLRSVLERLKAQNPALFSAPRVPSAGSQQVLRAPPAGTHMGSSRKRQRLEHTKANRNLDLPKAQSVWSSTCETATATTGSGLNALESAPAPSSTYNKPELPAGPPLFDPDQQRVLHETSTLLTSALEALDHYGELPPRAANAAVHRVCAALGIASALPANAVDEAPALRSLLQRGLDWCAHLLADNSPSSWSARAAVSEWVFLVVVNSSSSLREALHEEHLVLAMQTLREGLHAVAKTFGQLVDSESDEHQGTQRDGIDQTHRQAGLRQWNKCVQLVVRLTNFVQSCPEIAESQRFQSISLSLFALHVADTLLDEVLRSSESLSPADTRELIQRSGSLWSSTTRLLCQTYAAYAQCRHLVLEEVQTLLRRSRCGYLSEEKTRNSVVSPVTVETSAERWPPLELVLEFIDVVGRIEFAPLLVGDSTCSDASVDRVSARCSPTALKKRAAATTTTTTTKPSPRDLLDTSARFFDTVRTLIDALLSGGKATVFVGVNDCFPTILSYLRNSMRKLEATTPAPLIFLQFLIRHTQMIASTQQALQAEDHLLLAERCLLLANFLDDFCDTELPHDSDAAPRESFSHLVQALATQHPLWLALWGCLLPMQTDHETLVHTTTVLESPSYHNGMFRIQYSESMLSSASLLCLVKPALKRIHDLLESVACLRLSQVMRSGRATLRARAMRLFSEVRGILQPAANECAPSHVQTLDSVRGRQENTPELQSTTMVTASNPLCILTAHAFRTTTSACTPFTASNETALETASSSVDDMIKFASTCCLDVSPKVREAALTCYVSWMRRARRPSAVSETLLGRLRDISVAVRQKALVLLDAIFQDHEQLDNHAWSLMAAHILARLDDPSPSVQRLAQRVLLKHIFQRQLVYRERAPTCPDTSDDCFDLNLSDSDAASDRERTVVGQALRRRRLRVRYLDEQHSWLVSSVSHASATSASMDLSFQRLKQMLNALPQALSVSSSLPIPVLMERLLLVGDKIVCLFRAEATALVGLAMRDQAYGLLAILAQLDANLLRPHLPLLIDEIRLLAAECPIAVPSATEQVFLWILRALMNCTRVLGQARAQVQLWSTLESAVVRLILQLQSANDGLADEANRLLRLLHDHNEHLATGAQRSAAYWQRVRWLWTFVELHQNVADGESGVETSSAPSAAVVGLALQRLGRLIRYAPKAPPDVAIPLNNLHDRLLTCCATLPAALMCPAAEMTTPRLTVLSGAFECLLQLSRCDGHFALKQLPLWQKLLQSGCITSETTSGSQCLSLLLGIQERLLRHLVEFVESERAVGAASTATATLPSSASNVMRPIVGGRIRVQAEPDRDNSQNATTSSWENCSIAAIDESEKECNVMFGTIQSILPSLAEVLQTSLLGKSNSALVSAARLCQVALIEGILTPERLLSPLCYIFWTLWVRNEAIATTPKRCLMGADHPSAVAKGALLHLLRDAPQQVAAGLGDGLLTAWRSCYDEHWTRESVGASAAVGTVHAASGSHVHVATAKTQVSLTDAFLRLNLGYEGNEHVCGFLFSALKGTCFRRRVLQSLVQAITAPATDERYPLSVRCAAALFLATISAIDHTLQSQRNLHHELHLLLEALEHSLDELEVAVEAVLGSATPSDTSPGDASPQPMETAICCGFVLQLRLYLLLRARYHALRSVAAREALAGLAAPIVPIAWPELRAITNAALAQWRDTTTDDVALDEAPCTHPESDQGSAADASTDSVPDDETWDTEESRGDVS